MPTARAPFGVLSPSPSDPLLGQESQSYHKRKKARFSEYFPELRNPDCVPRKERAVDVVFFPPMLESGAALRGGWGKRPPLALGASETASHGVWDL